MNILLAKYISLIWNVANYMAALCAEFFITSQRMNYACNRAYGRFAVPPRINIRVCTHVKILNVHARSWQFSQHLNRTRLRDGNEWNLVHTRSIFCIKYGKLYLFSFRDHAFFKVHIQQGYTYTEIYFILQTFEDLLSLNKQVLWLIRILIMITIFKITICFTYVLICRTYFVEICCRAWFSKFPVWNVLYFILREKGEVNESSLHQHHDPQRSNFLARYTRSPLRRGTCWEFLRFLCSIDVQCEKCDGRYFKLAAIFPG